MPRGKKRHLAQKLADSVLGAIKAVERVPRPGAPVLPVLLSVSQKAFVEGQENVLVDVAKILKESGRVFRLGGEIVMLNGNLDDGSGSLARLSGVRSAAVEAQGILANLFVCEHQGSQFPPPAWLITVILASEAVRRELPEIKRVSRRIIFDEKFDLLTPGWHADSGTMINAELIEIVPYTVTLAQKITNRLPSGLKTLLADFCFERDADLANVLGILVTGLLGAHIPDGGRPFAILHGNQPCLGKSLLARVVNQWC